MAPKQKMSMAELSKMFGGNPNSGALPTRSEGKEEQRRDHRGRRDDEEFGGGGWRNQDRDGGGRGGFGDRDGGGRGFGGRDGGRFGDRDRDDGPGWRNQLRGGRDGGGGGGDDWKSMLSGRGGGPPQRAAPVSSEDRRANFGQGVRAKLRGETSDEPSEGGASFKPQTRAARAPAPPKEEKAKKPVYEKPQEEVEEGPEADLELCEDFRAELSEMWQRQNFSSLDDLPELGQAEFESGMACQIIAQTLMLTVRGKQPVDISKILTNAKPIFEWLWENDERRRVKVEFLFELQEACYQQKCPRLSAEWALVEAVFDGLYYNEILAEPYFFLWADDTKDKREGKIEVMFQCTHWIDWLKKAKVDGESSSDEEDSDEEEKDSDEDEEDEDDAYIAPLGGGQYGARGKELMARPPMARPA